MVLIQRLFIDELGLLESGYSECHYNGYPGPFSKSDLLSGGAKPPPKVSTVANLILRGGDDYYLVKFLLEGGLKWLRL